MYKKVKIIISLFVLVVIFCMIASVSYARYSYLNEGNNSVGVAKWDIVINDQSMNSEVVFDLFETVENNNLLDGTRLIAPGTEGSITFNISNNSDVVAEYTIVLEEVLNDNDIPIVYSLEKDGVYQDLSEFIVANSEEIKIGEKDKSVTLYWKWDFYSTTLQNEKDNQLGLSGNANILVNMKIRVNQKIG